MYVDDRVLLFDGQNSLGMMLKLTNIGRTILVIVSRLLLEDGRKVKLILYFNSAYSFIIANEI